MKPATLEAAREAKKKVVELFEGEEYVNGIGIGLVAGGYAVQVNLLDVTEPGSDLPSSVDGVPVLYRVSGDIRAH